MNAPLLSFVIGGAQKCGTTALANYLALHPRVRLPRGKEAHVFDAPDYREDWTTADVDAHLAGHFDSGSDDAMFGDATPISLFVPACVQRMARYNPAMRWIVLLRDPVERAISQHHMEHARGDEPLGLFDAVRAEPRRLRGHAQDLSPGSPLRHWSYAARGRYAGQLDNLYRHFPRRQVLLLRSRDLAEHTAQTVGQALDFLGLQAKRQGPYPPVFEGGYRPPGVLHPARLLLRWRLRGEKGLLRQRHGIDLDAD